MGVGTGRRNKSTSARTAHAQMPFHERPTLIVFPVGSHQWSWRIEQAGQTVTAGTPPASGPAVFNEWDHALDSVGLNHSALLQMAYAERCRERAGAVSERNNFVPGRVSANVQPSPG
jgi:hypothetical protein